jgi:hypothetical protein
MIALYRWPADDVAELIDRMERHQVRNVAMWWHRHWSESTQRALEHRGFHVWVHTLDFDHDKIRQFRQRGVNIYTNGYIDDLFGWNFVSNTNDPFDDNGHGTHVAGTIGASGNNSEGVAGVNWDVQLMGLKFLGAGGSGTTANAVAAVNYATMMANRGENVRLTNNSWGGGGFSQALDNAIAASGDADMLFIASAGNGARGPGRNDTARAGPRPAGPQRRQARRAPGGA